MAEIISAPDRARRLARAIASDVALYNEAKVIQGIQSDTLFVILKAEIEEGRQLFKTRVAPELFGQNIYDCAVVDVILKAKAHVKSKIW
jgi:hypothetical protein